MCPAFLFYKTLSDYGRNIHLVKILTKYNLTKKTKYLGVTLDSKLAYKASISYLLLKANCRLRQLYFILNKFSTTDP
jgi:hypothetical protein